MNAREIVAALTKSNRRAERLKRLSDNGLSRALIEAVWSQFDIGSVASDIADEAVRRLKARGFRAGEPDPVSPLDCDHRRNLMIQSGRGAGPGHTTSEHVTLCPDCGEFRVSTERNGVHAVTRFTLPTDELVRAAGQYARHLQAEE